MASTVATRDAAHVAFCYAHHMRIAARLLPLLVLVAVVVVAWASGMQHQLSWQAIGSHAGTWRGWVARDPMLAGLGYALLYALVVGLSLPAGGVLTVLGGVLFGVVAGAALAVAGASLGAVLLFLIARSTAGRLLTRRARPLIERFREPLERHGFWALLSLRLIPVVPFWLTNLAAALLGMRLLPFAIATVIGIAPATTVLAGIGAGAAEVLARGQAPDLSLLTSPGVLLPLLGLAALSLLPIAWRRWRLPGAAV